MRISPVLGVNRLTKAVSSESVELATSRPAAPPASDSKVLSVRSWRISCPRPAPSAARTASSRSRRSRRASERFATLAHAMSSTSAVVPSRISSSGRAWRVSSVSDSQGRGGEAGRGRVDARVLRCEPAADRSTSDSACARAMPGFIRPKTVSAEKTRRFCCIRFSAAARKGQADTDMYTSFSWGYIGTAGSTPMTV